VSPRQSPTPKYQPTYRGHRDGQVKQNHAAAQHNHSRSRPPAGLHYARRSSRLLKARGGAGKPGPMGIPQYRFSSAGRGGGRAMRGSWTVLEAAAAAAKRIAAMTYDADLADSTGAQVRHNSGSGKTMSDVRNRRCH
jgi:hypothetical protein